ncbi:hypothetical protein MN608_07776 [Microdochium nivale]|nr:hypothetical protein MN608_07776 [Microdochium nivale]
MSKIRSYTSPFDRPPALPCALFSSLTFLRFLNSVTTHATSCKKTSNTHVPASIPALTWTQFHEAQNVAALLAATEIPPAPSPTRFPSSTSTITLCIHVHSSPPPPVVVEKDLVFGWKLIVKWMSVSW